MSPSPSSCMSIPTLASTGRMSFFLFWRTSRIALKAITAITGESVTQFDFSSICLGSSGNLAYSTADSTLYGMLVDGCEWPSFTSLFAINYTVYGNLSFWWMTEYEYRPTSELDYDRLASVTLGSNGDAILAGTAVEWTPQKAGTIIRVDGHSGVAVWTQFFRDSAAPPDATIDVKWAGDVGEVVVGIGNTAAFGSVNGGFLLSLNASTGEFLTVQTIDYPGHVQGITQVIAHNSDLFLVGYFRPTTDTDARLAFVTKIVNGSTIEWYRSLTIETYRSVPLAITISATGATIFIGGQFWSGTDSAHRNCFIASISASSGAVNWVKTFGGPNYDEVHELVEMSNGMVAFCGYTTSYYELGRRHIFVGSINPSTGTVNAFKVFGLVAKQEYLYGMSAVDDDHVIIYGLADSKLAFLKLSPFAGTTLLTDNCEGSFLFEVDVQQDLVQTEPTGNVDDVLSFSQSAIPISQVLQNVNSGFVQRPLYREETGLDSKGYALLDPLCWSCERGCVNCEIDYQGEYDCDACGHGWYYFENECFDNCGALGSYWNDSTGAVAQCSPCRPECVRCSSLSECHECASDDYYLHDGMCLICSTGCNACESDTQCTECESDRSLVQGECIYCAEFCASCTSENWCTECVSQDYVLYNGTCLICPAHCDDCVSETECVECSPGFSIHDGDCFLCSSGCLTCLSESQCLQCDSTEYSLYEGYCYILPYGCVNSTDTTCIECAPEYFLLDGECILCEEGCLNCSSSGLRCYECEDEYFLFNEQCIMCPQYCIQCVEGGFCVECSTDTVLFAGECLVCGEGCLDCILTDVDDEVECTSCTNNYELSDGNCTLIHVEAEPPALFWLYTAGGAFGVIVLFICLGIIVACTVCSCVAGRQKRKLNQFREIEDIDILLNEQQLENEMVKASLKVDKKSFEIHEDEIKVKERLGELGNWDGLDTISSSAARSMTFLVEFRSNLAVFRCYSTSVFGNSNDSFGEYQKEVNILAQMHHPHILRFYGGIANDKRTGVLVEFCEHGHLKKFYESFKALKHEIKLSEKIRILSEVVSALSYVHERNIIHRDINWKNIMITKGFEVRLRNFGLSRVVKNMETGLTRSVGSHSAFMAPEVFFSSSYDKKVDIYSLGILMWCVIGESFEIYGEQWQDFSLQSVMNPNFRPSFDDKDNEMIFSSVPTLVQTMKKCWAHTASDRITLELVSDILLEERKAFEDDCQSKKSAEKANDELLEDEIKELEIGMNDLWKRKERMSFQKEYLQSQMNTVMKEVEKKRKSFV